MTVETGDSYFKTMNRLLYILMLFLAVSLGEAAAQTDKEEVRAGNRHFDDGEYSEAIIDYLSALEKDSLSLAANYNLASALYEMEDYDQAQKVMEKIMSLAAESGHASDYYYNLANISIANKQYQVAKEALETYLMEHPGDMKAKESYAYVKKKLEQQQQQQQQNQQQQDQDQDQNQDQNQNQNNDQDQQKGDQNKDKQENQDKKDNDNKDNDQQDDGGQDNKNQQGQSQNPNMSQKEARKVLQMVQAKENETQEKVNKEKAAAMGRMQREKNW